MSYWYHRNPLKGTTAVDFNLQMVCCKADAVQICSELKRLRTQLIQLFSDLTSNPVEVDQSMNDYLSLLLGLIAPPGGGIKPEEWKQMRYCHTFKWTDSLLGNVPNAKQDVMFEIICILQEQAIWLSKFAANVAASADVNEDQAKQVYKALLKAAGIFQHVQNNLLEQMSEQPVPGSDLDSRVCNAYANQCLAEAQEVTIARAIELKHSSQLIAGLCAEASRTFQKGAISLKTMNSKGSKESVVGKGAKWAKYLELKSRFYQAYAFCFYGENLLALEKCGDAIRSLQESEQVLQQMLADCKEYNKLKGVGMAARPELHPAMQSLVSLVKRTKDKCERENGLLFHQKIGIEKPVVDLKPAHGLANAEPFKTPSLHQLWTAHAYQAFDLKTNSNEKQPKKDQQPLPDVKERNAQQTNGAAAPKNESGCSIQ